MRRKKRMSINRYVKIVIYVVVFFGAWNLVDYLYSTFITREGYVFGTFDNLLLPLICGIVLGAFFFFRENKKNKS